MGALGTAVEPFVGPPKARAMVGRVSAVGLLFAVFGISDPAVAHHSRAVFDLTREIALTGTVLEYRYASPHPWISLMVKGDAAASRWEFECQSAAKMYDSGVTQRSLKPGDKVYIHAYPFKGGQLGGKMIDITLADGRFVSWRGSAIADSLRERGAD